MSRCPTTQTPFRRIARLALVVALVALGGAAGEVQGQVRDRALFERGQSTLSEDSVGQPDRTRRRGRRVRPNVGALRDAAASDVTLNLFNDVELRARRTRLDRTPRGGEVWHGRLLDVAGEATIAVNSGVMAGTVIAGDKVYEIVYAGDGDHEVRELDPSAFPTDDPDVHLDPIAADPQAGEVDALVAADMAPDSASQIDVLVVWTPSARTAAGGTAAMQSLVDLSIANTNQAYANSNVVQRIRLVYAGEIAYTEAGASTDLSRLAGTGDGFMDTVHTLRNTHGADVVTLIGSTYAGAGICGLGYLMSYVTTGFASSAFNLVDRQCAASNLSYAHELGHNMGLHHDPANASGNPAYPYAFGYQDPGGAFRTVMSYGSATRIRHFSNPSVSYNGKVTGTDSQNNALALNNTAATVANFRQAVTGGSCTYSLGSSSASVASGAATGSVSVVAGSGCAWTAASNAAWLTISSGSSGTSNGAVGYSVAANGAGTSRTGTLTVAGHTFTVTQAAAACAAFTLSSTSTSVGAGGGTFGVSVTGMTGCARTATSNASWITVTAGATGTGSGSVSLSVAANPTGTSRTGTATIAGQTFTVTQAGAACAAFTLSSTSTSVGAGGGTFGVSVTGMTGCARTATSNASWITVTSGATGTGTGSVSLSVAANTAATSRTGTVTIAGVTFTVTQAAAACAAFTLSPTSASVAAGGGTVNVTASGTAGCARTATSNAAWITVASGATGTGSGIVSLSVAANAGSSRSGTATVAGRTVTISQAAAPPVTVSALSVTPSLPAVAGTPITWTATASGGSTPLLYQFWRYSQSSNTWTMVRDYATSPSYTWATQTSNGGTHALQVWVKQQSSTKQYDAFLASGSFTLTTVSSATPVSPLKAFAAGAPSPRVAGTPLSWTIGTTGGSSPHEFKFWVYSDKLKAWAVARDYGTGNSLVWTPPVAGRYALQAWVRNAGSTADYTVYVASGEFDVAPGSSGEPTAPPPPTGPAPSAVQLTADRPAPFQAGAVITLTATTLGTTAPTEHKFWEFANGTWRVLREFGPSATVQWQPTAGTRALQVWTRRVGSTKDYEVYAASGYVTVLP